MSSGFGARGIAVGTPSRSSFGENLRVGRIQSDRLLMMLSR